MTIYEHRTSMTVSGGSKSSTTLRIVGGLCRQLLIRSNTSTTIFRVDLQDSNGKTRRNYDFHQGELNDMELALPVVGNFTINLTNVSPDDTFDLIMAVQE